ncbi:hypothetical protein HOF46_02740, partial [Candidatus Woesearchaeota archaeon]|nr:hypothetical protein [Candidatus Woesearchaeota archaeon]
MDVTFIILGALVFVAVIWVLFSAGFIKKPARTLEDIANSEEEDLQTVKWASEPSEERKHEESPYTVKHFDRPLYHGTTSGIFAILGLTQDYRLLSYDQLMEEDIVPFGGELLYGIQFEKGVSHDNVSFSESLSTATAEYARPQSNDLVGQILRYVDRRATEKLACPKCNYHKFPDEEIDDCNKCGSDLTRTKELQHEYRTIAIPLKNGLTPELFSSLKDLEKRD